MLWSRKTIFLMIVLAAPLVVGSCFDWNIPDDYDNGADGDGDTDVDGDSDSDLGQGGICTGNTDCQDGFLCGGNTTDQSSMCRLQCTSTADCAVLGVNSICGLFERGGLLCTVPCDPFNSNCPNGVTCSVFDPELDGTAGTLCVGTVGFGMEGEYCDTTADCAVGMTCANFGAGNVGCAPYCSTPGGTDTACTYQTCVPFDPDTYLADGRPVGVCRSLLPL